MPYFKGPYPRNKVTTTKVVVPESTIGDGPKDSKKEYKAKKEHAKFLRNPTNICPPSFTQPRRSRYRGRDLEKRCPKRRAITPTELGPPLATSSPRYPEEHVLSGASDRNRWFQQISPIPVIDPLPPLPFVEGVIQDLEEPDVINGSTHGHLATMQTYIGRPLASSTPRLPRKRKSSAEREQNCWTQTGVCRQISPIPNLEPLPLAREANVHQDHIDKNDANEFDRYRRATTPTGLGPPLATSTPRLSRKRSSSADPCNQIRSRACRQISPITPMDPLLIAAKGKHDPKPSETEDKKQVKETVTVNQKSIGSKKIPLQTGNVQRSTTTSSGGRRPNCLPTTVSRRLVRAPKVHPIDHIQMLKNNEHMSSNTGSEFGSRDSKRCRTSHIQGAPVATGSNRLLAKTGSQKGSQKEEHKQQPLHVCTDELAPSIPVIEPQPPQEVIGKGGNSVKVGWFQAIKKRVSKVSLVTRLLDGLKAWKL